MLGAALPASSHADHPSLESQSAQRTTSGLRGQVATHGDPIPDDRSGASEPALPPAQAAGGAVAQDVPDATCTPVANTADNTANSPYPAGSPVFKVIYAHTSDQTDDFAADAPVIAAGAKAVSEFVLSETGGQLSVRWDLGTTQGANCLDIQKVSLPEDRDFYVVPEFNGSDKTSFEEVEEDTRALFGAQGSGPRNFLVFVDEVPRGVYGEASRWTTESPSGSLQNGGGLFAVMYGAGVNNGGTDFFGSTTAFPAGTTSRNHLEYVLHEVSHTLGAVGPSAPNTSGKGHCNDEYDVLCYEDGGPGTPFLRSGCNGANPPADQPYGFALQAWDCGRDDYFSMDPAAGSYLGVNWNIANSAFLDCEIAVCTRPGIRQSPPAVTPPAVQPPAVQQPAAPAKKKPKKKKKKKRKGRGR